jgi:predicted outer membrane repeat protein
MRRLLFITGIFASFLVTSSTARIINIPADYATIQAGIDAGVNGDTVLVAEGTYHERIDFVGKGILVASGFIDSGDTLQIQNTVIDADTSVIGPADLGSVISFTSGEDSMSVIRGFTIKKGIGYRINLYNRAGGAIFCMDNSSPKILDNIICENAASFGGGIYMLDTCAAVVRRNKIMNNTGNGIVMSASSAIIEGNTICRNFGGLGGGISCNDGSNAIISDNIIFENHGGLWGGGIYCEQSSPTITRNLIYKNSAADWAGGICCNEASPTIINNVISDNTAGGDGGGLYCFNNSTVTIVNTIIWADTPPEIGTRSGGAFQITYSDIRGGWEGQGNIDDDPFFVSAYEGDFNICSQSPCINAGDPSITDPDGSVSDIGIYYSDHPVCEIGRIVHVSIRGSDEDGDGTSQNPFRTIGHGIDESYSSDTILVENGLYTENPDVKAKSIRLVSLYIYSHDTIDIQNTVIDGGADSTTVIFSNCFASSISGFTIINGRGWFGGGVVSNYSELSISHNVITENSTDAPGGGIYCQFGRTEINNNRIFGNDADMGGGIYGYQGVAVIEYNIISGNNASTGGGLRVYNLLDGSFVNNNIIIANSAYRGGGYDCFGTVPPMANNVFSLNSASTYGGAIYCSYASPELINSILWADSALTDGNEIYVGDESSPIVTYCDIQGGWQGEGNIDLYPLFRYSDDYFHLMSTACGDTDSSPCIDAGHPDSVDVVLGCEYGMGGSRADMGAYGGRNSDWITGMDDSPGGANLPLKVSLSQNHPNPFNPSTIIQYDLPRAADVRLEIFDILGRRIETLIDARQEAGHHTAIWDGKDNSSGIYFYRIKAGDYTETKKMLLLR